MDELRHFLRAATRDEHARVDAVFSQLDLSQREGYGAFLIAQARVLPPLEQAVAAAGLWPDAAPRSAALAADLADLMMSMPAAQPGVEFRNPAELWGALYVVEGSRLGGKVLARRVGAGFPMRFLERDAAGQVWVAFQAAMARSPMLARPTGPADVLAGARKTFAAFESAGLERLAERRPATHRRSA